jgi:hypothetical protein
MHRNETHPHSPPRQQYQVPNTRTYFVKHDFSGSAELTTTVAHALSDVSGIDVTDAGFTLSDHVDPDALDSPFEPNADGTPLMNGHPTFTAMVYRVTVYTDGQVAIAPPQGNGV